MLELAGTNLSRFQNFLQFPICFGAQQKSVKNREIGEIEKYVFCRPYARLIPGDGTAVDNCSDHLKLQIVLRASTHFRAWVGSSSVSQNTNFLCFYKYSQF